MANVNNPFGLEPLMRNQGGGAVECEKISKAVGYGQAIFKWDPVTQLAGFLNGPASGITAGTTRYKGVALNYGAASTLTEHQVVISKEALYVVQEDATGAANAVAAKMGYNANLAFGTAGGGVTRDNSGAQLSGTSINTTSSLDVRINKLFEAVDNAYGANARLEVRFNKHLDNAEITAT